MNIRLVHSAILSALFGAALPASAQEPAPPPEKPAIPPEKTSTSPTQGDPTVADPGLMRYLAAAPGGANATRIPGVRLRGKLINRGGTSAVILEIDGRFHFLRQGASLSPGGEYGQTTLLLKEVNRDGVVLEAQPLNQTLTLQ